MLDVAELRMPELIRKLRVADSIPLGEVIVFSLYFESFFPLFPSSSTKCYNVQGF